MIQGSQPSPRQRTLEQLAHDQHCNRNFCWNECPVVTLPCQHNRTYCSFMSPTAMHGCAIHPSAAVSLCIIRYIPVGGRCAHRKSSSAAGQYAASRSGNKGTRKAPADDQGHSGLLAREGAAESHTAVVSCVVAESMCSCGRACCPVSGVPQMDFEGRRGARGGVITVLLHLFFTCFNNRITQYEYP